MKDKFSMHTDLLRLIEVLTNWLISKYFNCCIPWGCWEIWEFTHCECLQSHVGNFVIYSLHDGFKAILGSAEEQRNEGLSGSDRSCVRNSPELHQTWTYWTKMPPNLNLAGLGCHTDSPIYQPASPQPCVGLEEIPFFPLAFRTHSQKLLAGQEGKQLH